jgi:hypothetical protein
VKFLQGGGLGTETADPAGDILIDEVRFRKDEVIFYARMDSGSRQEAARDLIAAGYRFVDIRRCPLNAWGGGPLSSPSLFFTPTPDPHRSRDGQDVSGRGGFLLFADSVHHFLFLTNYRAAFHLSTAEHGGSPKRSS